jgi:hypothetical protein
MAFKNAKGMSAASQKAAQEARERAEKEAAQKGVARIKLNPGPNILMMLPSFDEAETSPYRPVLAHYNPFHLCLRADPYEDADGAIVTDKRFGACPRCQTGWDAYAARRDQLAAQNPNLTSDELKKVVQNDQTAQIARSNLSSEQLLFQAVDLTPFFKIEKIKTSYRVSVDSEKMSYMGEFADVLAGRSEGKGLPEDLLNAAKIGPCLMLVAKTWGNKIRTSITDRYLGLGEVDPLLDPVNNLLRIDLVKGDTQMNGKDVYAWNPSLMGQRELPGLSLSDELMEAIESKAKNIWSLEEEDESIEALSRAFKKAPSADVLTSWLHEQGWSLSVPDADEESSVETVPTLLETEESPVATKSKGLFDKYKNS